MNSDKHDEYFGEVKKVVQNSHRSAQVLMLWSVVDKRCSIEKVQKQHLH